MDHPEGFRGEDSAFYKERSRYSPIKQSNSYSMRENSPKRVQISAEDPNDPRGRVEAANLMRTQPMKVDLGLEHGNTYY